MIFQHNINDKDLSRDNLLSDKSYILRYTGDFPIAVVEAKAEDKPVADGLQQAKDYAAIRGLRICLQNYGYRLSKR